MIVTITGIGLWTRGLHCWQDLLTHLEGDGGSRDLSGEFESPRPAAIPARERRRAGLTINLAVEVMHQACEMAGEDKAGIGSVFTSAMGDTDVTDYMCRKLATAEKLLSPTRFHNSVHNAPSGYWSISATNRHPSSFVGGFLSSFPCALMEAASCSLAEGLPVGLAAYDVANRAPFGDVLPIAESLGLALLMVPGGRADGWRLELTVEAGAGTAPVPESPALRRLADANPMGTGLALLETMATQKAVVLRWPVGGSSRLSVAVSPC